MYPVLILSELTARPAASEHAQKYLDEIKQIVNGWEKNKSWLPKDKIQELLSEADKVKNWLAEKEEEQKKTSGFSTPAFTSEDVYLKVLSLQDKVTKINRIPKPKPKVEKPANNESETQSSEDKESTAKSSDDKTNTSDTESEQAGRDTEGSSTAQSSPDSAGHDDY
ncbi:hypothetical protein RJ641_013085 [Dillenia turbinata]|uniref:Uncharacterized protein n=1 Tax=Dillenia turbinata TaxID=194707 RepID=A0AAN8ZPP5_9MAGN